MQIDDRPIGPERPPYIIAELSNNHLKSLEKAKDLIRAAHSCGVDAVKIQTYTADSLTIDCNEPDFVIRNPLWQGKTYYQLYHQNAMPLEWTSELFDYAHEWGVTLFSSPFDIACVDLLERCNAPAYKIASFEAAYYDLVARVVATGKPVIISTGAVNLGEIERTLQRAGATSDRTALLHCVSEYPTHAEDMNLLAISRLQQLGYRVGLSDHSLDNTAAIASVALGACIIEKHFTLRRSDGGPDAAFSLEPSEMAALVMASRRAWAALGSAEILDETIRRGSEHRRSIYVVAHVRAGESLSVDHLRIIRPGFGLPPEQMERVLGATAKRALRRGTALSLADIELRECTK